MTFEQLNMHPSILRAITSDGYETPTDIQAEAIPHLIAGLDILGSAQTGTGKTAAFALPIIHHVQNIPNDGKKRLPKALILAPTRELALQIKESFDRYSRKNDVKAVAIYGGMPKRKQIIKVKRGVDILIATPGRLLDLMNMKVIKLSTIRHFVLDEADQMLDMGFIDDVDTIIRALPKDRQTMMFSATIPKEIAALSKRILTNPVRIEVTPQNTPLETINQSVFFLKGGDKIKLLKDTVLGENVTSALVFVRTKRDCDAITRQLKDAGVNADAIHGDRSQSQRQKTLNQFKKHETQVLVATDVAARGIDIDALSHVINFDMPEKPETYLHRIGRTARAGKLGSAYSFCSPKETHLLKAIQKHIEMRLPVDSDHEYIQKSKPSPRKKSRPSNDQNKGPRQDKAFKGAAAKKKKPKNKRNFDAYAIESRASNRKNTKKTFKNKGKKKSFNKPAYQKAY
ncbi:MAG: DEAD/DEAH box helicase [Bacillota bacterium]